MHYFSVSYLCIGMIDCYVEISDVNILFQICWYKNLHFFLMMLWVTGHKIDL